MSQCCRCREETDGVFFPPDEGPKVNSVPMCSKCRTYVRKAIKALCSPPKPDKLEPQKPPKAK